MGGESKQTQQTSSTTNPWEPAQGALKGILGQLDPLIANSGLSSASTNAIDQLQQSANQGNPYAGQIDSFTQNLLNGGGANNQAGNIQSGYDAYKAQTNPLASNTNYDPMQTPGLADALATLKSDITGSVNGQFAAAGRDSSGYNQQALGRGLTQGLAPVIVDQYNKNIQNQQTAAGNLYNASNTNSGLLAGLNQAALGNQQQGMTNSADALAAKNYAPTQTLALEQLKQSIPAQNLGLLAQIGIPIAGLGGQSTGTSNTTNQMSGAQQFGQIAGGINSLFGGGSGGGSGAVANIFKMFSDRRLKEEIEQVGALFDGTPVYRYRYVNSPTFQIGLIADEVEKYAPEAVETIHGFKAVDYKLATNKALEAA